MEEAVQEWGIKRKAMQFLVPDSLVVVRKLQVPIYLPYEEIKGYLYIELGNTIHLPFEDPILDFTILKSTEEYHEILIFAAPENVMNEYKTIFESCSLRPLTAELSSLSLFRLYQLMDNVNTEENIMILKLDQFGANIGIYQNGLPLFIQNEFLSHVEVSDHLQNNDFDRFVEPLDELIESIGRVIHFYKYNMMSGLSDLHKIILTGDHSLIELAYKKLKSQYTYEIIVMDYGIEIDNEDEKIPMKYYACIGLGLKEV
jgi:type IV pilus assembly protein PilM